MQEIILKSEMGVSRLMDVLVDAREVLRNDALLLLIQLTKGHANLQKIVAFENAFDKLCDIIETVMIFELYPRDLVRISIHGCHFPFLMPGPQIIL